MLQLREFSCFYKVKEGFAVAVDKVSLQVPRGQFLVLMGPSGCGKTTLLRGIAGLLDYTQGQASIGGVAAEDFDKRSNAVSYVSQEYVLYPHLTVYENIAYPLRSSRRRQEEVDALVREMAAAVGLEKLLTRLPRQLSGGQQQRLAIARALVKEPELVLYDEPFSNVEPALRRQLRELIYSVARDKGQTVIYVTHDSRDAAELADRVVWMEEGQLRDTLPEDLSLPAPAPRSKTGLFRQREAAEDYEERMLPHTRKQQFWDICRTQGRVLVRLGVLLLLLSLPLQLIGGAESLLAAQLGSGDLSPEQQSAYGVYLSNAAALGRILGCLVMAPGLAGAVHILRQLVWGEPVIFRQDLLRGIRQNIRQMLLLCGLMGAFAFLCTWLAGLAYTAPGLSGYLLYLPPVLGIGLLPAAVFGAVCMPVYQNSFVTQLRLGLGLYLGRFFPNLGLLALTLVPGAVQLFPNFYLRLAGGILTALVLPVLLLIWSLAAHSQLDRTVNPRQFPHLVGKGLAGQ